MIATNKDIVNVAIELLIEDGVFNNPFLDKGMFKVEMTRAVSKDNFHISNMDKTINDVIQKCLETSLENTITGLVNKGIISEDANDEGNPIYKLNK